MTTSISLSAARAGIIILCGLSLPLFYLIFGNGLLTQSSPPTVAPFLAMLALELTGVILVAYLFDRRARLRMKRMNDRPRISSAR